MVKKLIATDFDGTLFINGNISNEVRKAIELWRADGRYFGIVTGRGSDFFEKVKEEKIPTDFLVLYNGSLAADGNNNVFYEKFIPADLFLQIERVLSEYKDIEQYSVSDGNPQHQFYATFGNVERALNVKSDLESMFGDRLAVFVNGRHINIGIAGSGKTEGVRVVLEHFSLSKDDAAVVGDDFNDIEMIKAFDGWAVESGKAEVVKAAPHICKDVGSLAITLLNKSFAR